MRIRFGFLKFFLKFALAAALICHWRVFRKSARLTATGGGRAYFPEPFHVGFPRRNANLPGPAARLRGSWIDAVYLWVCLGSNRTNLRKWTDLFLQPAYRSIACSLQSCRRFQLGRLPDSGGISDFRDDRVGPTASVAADASVPQWHGCYSIAVECAARTWASR